MNTLSVVVRDVRAVDVQVLARIKPPVALHVDRLRYAKSNVRYLVAEGGMAPIGFACLVFKRPPDWSDSNDSSRLPQIVDMMIAKGQRGNGYGSVFLRGMESLCYTLGHDRVFLSVDPVENARAHALYMRHGYQQLQAYPYKAQWKFTDSDSKVHSGSSWAVDMVKQLGESA